MRLMFTHNNANPPIHQWVRAGKKLLLRNEQAKAIGSRIQIGSKQTKNLQRTVGGYKGSKRMENPPPDAGCSKCSKCKVVCPFLVESKTFKSENCFSSCPIQELSKSLQINSLLQLQWNVFPSCSYTAMTNL